MLCKKAHLEFKLEKTSWMRLAGAVCIRPFFAVVVIMYLYVTHHGYLEVYQILLDKQLLAGRELSEALF